MECEEHLQTILSRVQFIADVSLVAQCDADEYKTALSLIADLTHGTIPTTEPHERLEVSELLEYLKNCLEKNIL